MAEFKAKNGRDASETEIKQWMQTLSEANLDIGALAGAADEAETEETPKGKGKRPLQNPSSYVSAKKSKV
jgi:hypothetical protein